MTSVLPKPGLYGDNHGGEFEAAGGLARRASGPLSILERELHSGAQLTRHALFSSNVHMYFS